MICPESNWPMFSRFWPIYLRFNHPQGGSFGFQVLEVLRKYHEIWHTSLKDTGIIWTLLPHYMSTITCHNISRSLPTKSRSRWPMRPFPPFPRSQEPFGISPRFTEWVEISPPEAAGRWLREKKVRPADRRMANRTLWGSCLGTFGRRIWMKMDMNGVGARTIYINIWQSLYWRLKVIEDDGRLVKMSEDDWSQWIIADPFPILNTSKRPFV